jgi:hypothetical protein
MVAGLGSGTDESLGVGACLPDRGIVRACLRGLDLSPSIGGGPLASRALSSAVMNSPMITCGPQNVDAAENR